MTALPAVFIANAADSGSMSCLSSSSSDSSSMLCSRGSDVYCVVQTVSDAADA
jgi:hypothetical protein